MKIVLGAMSPELKDQLKDFMTDETAINHCQEDADAITRLHLRDLLTDHETEQARKRLMKKINAAIIA